MTGVSGPILAVQNLSVSFPVGSARARAVDGVSFQVEAGKTVGLVGESGCGKSVTALSLLRLIPPPGLIEGGEILLNGRNLLQLREREMEEVRGNFISMIFQEPMTSLNPVYTVGTQIVEAIRLHQKVSRSLARERAIQLLRRVGIAAADDQVDAYPHTLSGGQRQRVMIAMALACEPKVLVADEPTTALDVTIQAQILNLIQDLKKDLGMGVLLITHDLGVVAEHADEVLVMYGGHIVESAPSAELFARPKHPYTRGLLGSVPRPREPGKVRAKLAAIDGVVPDLSSTWRGCRFAARCPLVIDRCVDEEPPLIPANGRSSRCFRAEEV